MLALNTSPLAATVVILSLYWVISSLYKAIRLRHVPGPWPAKFSSLWRVWFVHDGSAHQGYRTLHHQYGPIVRTAPNVVDISDPAAIPIIYGIQSKFTKDKFYTAFVTWYKGSLLDNVFTVRSNDMHKALKRPVAQKFSMTSIRSLEGLVDPCSRIFLDAMLELQGQTIDFGVWLQWYAFDVIGEITFNKRFGFMEQRKDVYDIIAGIDMGLLYVGIISQIPSLHPWLLGSRWISELLGKLTNNAGNPLVIVEEMVEDAIRQYGTETEGKPDREDFFTYLQKERMKDNGGMNELEFIGHLAANLLAGSDTTAISLRAVFYYLLKNKQAYQTLQEEIDRADKAGKLSPLISYGESLELEYLQAVLKEAMRMHPSVQYPLERRVPAGGVTICEKYLPEGCIVGINPGIIHRNTDIFGKDANVFRPERWLSSDVEEVKRMDRNILTFGAGTRTCIGKNISLMEMGKLVPQILRQFDLEWASDKSEWQIHTYFFAKQTGLLVRMRPRHSKKR